MADLAQLERALINADAAGDSDAARVFAAEIQKMRNAAPMPTQSAQKEDKGILQNLALGALKGTTDEGTTILTPADWAYDKTTGNTGTHQWRKDKLAQFYDENANPDSLSFKLGSLASNIAGTAGVGGALGSVAKMIPALTRVAPALPAALESGGMVAPGAGMLTRAAGGAITGGATAGLINPDEAGLGAAIGGALPGGVKAAGAAGSYLGGLMSDGAKRLMQSAIKPTIAQLRSGDADVAVNTLLANGINPTKGGVDKLRALIDDLNSQISNKISGSSATVDKQQVLNSLGSVRGQFGNQVSPTADMAAIQSVADDFANHPLLPGNDIPVQLAQDLKQGTYRVLAKKYGQMGSADTEAQKGLARGLKEGIANAVPGVQALNDQESALIKTLGVTERRAMMELNKNPLGLAALAVHEPSAFVAFMADKSALFKSLAARAVQNASNGVSGVGGLLDSALPNPALRSGLLAWEANP